MLIKHHCGQGVIPSMRIVVQKLLLLLSLIIIISCYNLYDFSHSTSKVKDGATEPVLAHIMSNILLEQFF